MFHVQCSYTLLNRGSINLGKTEFSIQVIAGASGLQRAWIKSLLLAARRNYCSVRRSLSIKWRADLWLPRRHWTLSKSCFWCLPQTLSCFSYHPRTSSNSISAKQWVNLRYSVGASGLCNEPSHGVYQQTLKRVKDRCSLFALWGELSCIAAGAFATDSAHFSIENNW